MTQEEKLQFKVKDLCARLPYDVVCAIDDDTSNGMKLGGIKSDKAYFKDLDGKDSDGLVSLERVKPYLRPMSSMTEEERKEENRLWDIITKTRNDLHYLYTDFLLSHHLDYRGLIEKGLACEAPKDMYK